MSIENEYHQLILRTSKNIKRQRLKAGLSQKDMEHFGFDLKNYQKIEYGKRPYSLYTVFRLAKAFQCQMRELIEE